MLKIKDSIDLKELEKFGFDRYKYSENTGEKTKLVHNNFNWDWLYIDIKSKEIKSGIRCACSDTYSYPCYSEQINIIYDLIQAGLVEKVEEN